MPYLKFTRDHRGYDHTLLIDTVRRRGREQSRVLYWFRTPPHVKVGRSAIDEDAIRALENAYPDVSFDWNRILEAHAPDPEPVFDDPRRRPRAKGTRERERDGRHDGKPERAARPEPLPAATDARAGVEGVGTSPDGPAGHAAGIVRDRVQPVALPDTDDLPAVPDLELGPVADEAAVNLEDAVPAARASEPSAAERILGSEGLQRLRARHAEVCARIAAQVPDPERQEALRSLAERLNPDVWVTEPDVRAGLEQFEQVLDQVRREVGPVRKRTRRGGRRNRRRREGPTGAVPGTAAPPDQPAGEPIDDGPEDDGDAGEP